MEDKFKISNKIKFCKLNKNVVIVVYSKISMRPSVTTTVHRVTHSVHIFNIFSIFYTSFTLSLNLITIADFCMRVKGANAPHLPP